ncbi:MAG: hypothetical protein IJX92_03350 [Clostridia bacterium]|nr:hypothetical protein [Clostridia bacterium]
MKKSNIVWGIILIALGVLIALRAFGIFDFDLFFDGWWTLFIIVPSLIALFTEKRKLGSIIGLVIGVLLLLCAWEIFDYDIIVKLIVPLVIVAVGVKLIIGGRTAGKAAEILNGAKGEGRHVPTGFAAFSESVLSFPGEKFTGAELTAVFGGVECDLRGAIIDSDTAINVTAIFGGVDIFVPDGVKVVVNSTAIFGGTDDKTEPLPTADKTLYIKGLCMFGGITVK